MLVDCKSCEAIVDAKILQSYDSFDPEIGIASLFSFLTCPKCASPFLVMQENYGNDEWDEALRIFGNEAAHDVDVTISNQDAKDIIDFTDALLEYVFTFKNKFNKFTKRREKQKLEQNNKFQLERP